MTNQEAIDKLMSLYCGVITRDKVDDACLKVINFLREQECKFCPKCGQAIDWEDIEHKDGK